MLLSDFKSIRGNHRPQQPGVSLYHHGQVSETIHGVNIREPLTQRLTFKDYNIQTVDSGYIQKLENLEKRHHNTRDPPRLVNVKLLEEVGSLGKGADAECVLYKEKNTGKSIVHKKYYGEPRERERDALVALHHKNIPAVYGMTEEDGRHVLQMEFCGPSLRHWKKNRVVQEAEILEIFEQLTDVLSHLDNHNVIHRDIKPDNVCIQTASTGLIVKLIDFGSVQTAQDKVAQGGRFTAAYMAPEMYIFCTFPATPVTSKADVFACALTICYLLYDADVIPQVLGTNDQNQIKYQMIYNPSCVYDYVMQTFPLDEYSMGLMTLLLKMLKGRPGGRISAADAHKEIVQLRRSTVFETLNAEEIKDNLGIDIVQHTASVYPETGPNIEEKVDYVPDCVTLQGETDSLPPRVTGDGYNQTFSDFLLSLVSSEQGTTAPIYTAGVGLLYQTCQRTKYTLPRGTEPPETIMPDRSIWQSSINEPIHTGIFPPSEVCMSIQQSQEILVDDALYGYPQENVLDLVPANQVAGTTAVPEGYPHTAVHEGHQQNIVHDDSPLISIPEGRQQTAVHEGCPQATVPEGRPQNIVHEDFPLISIPAGRQHTAVHEGCPQTTVPEGSIHNAVPEDPPLTPVPEVCLQTAILEGRPHIPNQEQLLLIQNSRANSMQNTNVSYGKGIINLKLGGSQLQEDGHDVTNPACPDKAPGPPAKPETMDKLKYRLQTGARKRCCPVLPNEYTNIPNLDLIHCKKKRREND